LTRFAGHAIEFANRTHRLAAIHGLEPCLPWNFHRSTQALEHDLVMRAHRRHMAKLGPGCGARSAAMF
jgi:hypothetical protein